MRRIETSALEVARTWVGTRERPGDGSNPAVLGMLQGDASWVEDDETPWCSAFANEVCRRLGLPRSRSLAARSWLLVGEPVLLSLAEPGLDVVVFKRGGGNQPGPSVIKAPGHVAFFEALEGDLVRVVGGNQGDAVTSALFPAKNVLGVRRLA
jgi:uncharacterized protein (TIGR02594 family)